MHVRGLSVFAFSSLVLGLALSCSSNPAESIGGDADSGAGDPCDLCGGSRMHKDCDALWAACKADTACKATADCVFSTCDIGEGCSCVAACGTSAGASATSSALFAAAHDCTYCAATPTAQAESCATACASYCAGFSGGSTALSCAASGSGGAGGSAGGDGG